MGEADRDRYRKDVLSLAARLSGDVAETAVWEVYAGTEKLIAILRFKLDFETPGVFAKLPKAKDPAELIGDARKLLSEASEEIAQGRLVDSVRTLRKARNDLRSYLVGIRRSATRAKGTPVSGRTSKPT